MEPSSWLSIMQSPSTGAQYAAMAHIPYCKAVGTLIYAMLGTHPDISYTVTIISKYVSNPGIPHWEAVKRIYYYLGGTIDLRLTFGGEVNELTGYADVDGSMEEDHHTLSSNAYLIDGGTVSWSMKRQEIMSLSTTKSEYIAAMHAAKEGLWL